MADAANDSMINTTANAVNLKRCENVTTDKGPFKKMPTSLTTNRQQGKL